MITEDPKANSRPSKSPNPLPKDNQIDDILEDLMDEHLDAIHSLVRTGDRGTMNMYYDGPAIAKSLDKFKAALATAIREARPSERDTGLTGGSLEQRRNNEFWNQGIKQFVEALRGMGLDV